MPWTDQERDILKQLYLRGVSLNEIAKVLKSRTPEAIKYQARMMGLRRPAQVEIDEEYYRKLAEIYEI
jgi:hypothetical protein